ncbi:MAG: hypothetical protein M1825_005126 [Sarcosagium campestre]|nr:MAG: hypothetical protein M1825_005126 [Sarcosagium campestre]
MTGVKLCHFYTSAYKMDRQFLRLSRTSRPSQIAIPESLFDFGSEPASYWQHMSLNEGSFISPYEDFRYLAAGDFRPPSMVKGLLKGPSPGASRTMENLTSLHYRAVSPAEPHAQDLVELVARCPALETLTVQLGDLLGCLWLEDEDDKSRDQILGYAVDDILDCYYTIIPAVASLGGKSKLRRFVSYDCGSEIDELDGLEDEIDELLYSNRWGIIARGEWEKLEERATSPGWSDPDDYEDGGYDEYDEHYEEGHEEWGPFDGY